MCSGIGYFELVGNCIRPVPGQASPYLRGNDGRSIEFDAGQGNICPKLRNFSPLTFLFSLLVNLFLTKSLIKSKWLNQ